MPETTPKTEPYPYIRVWGTYMGSYPYYIEDEKRRAAEDGAPPDAIYRTWIYEKDGSTAPGNYSEEEMQRYGIRKVWRRASQIERADTRHNVAQICDRLGIPRPAWEDGSHV